MRNLLRTVLYRPLEKKLNPSRFQSKRNGALAFHADQRKKIKLAEENSEIDAASLLETKPPDSRHQPPDRFENIKRLRGRKRSDDCSPTVPRFGAEVDALDGRIIRAEATPWRGK